MKFQSFTEPSNNRSRRWPFIPLFLVLIPFLCLLLTSCNGSGGAVAGGGIDGTGIMSAGVVTAFGSIEVNGTEFDTTHAVVVVNGVEVGIGDDVVLDNLRIGMVVSVEGRLLKDGNMVADRVLYSNNVNGPVESIQIGTNEKILAILGQTVVVNFITKFEPETYDYDSIAPDDIVRISGYFDDERHIRATFVEKTGVFNPGSTVEVEVTGVVSNLDSDFDTFEINSLTVNFAEIANELPEGIPADGLLVEVVGTFDTPGGDVIADHIDLAEELDRDDGNEFEIMGFVTEKISDGDIIKFKVGNQEVHANADPDIVVYVDGEPSDIAPGQKLEAEGVLEGGVLFADEVEFWKPDQIEVEGIVDDVTFVDDYPEFTFEEREDQLFVTSEEIGTAFEDIEKENIEAGIELEIKGRPIDPEQSIIEADKVSFELE